MVASNRSTQQWTGNPEAAGSEEVRFGKRRGLDGRLQRIVESKVGDEMAVKTVEQLTPAALNVVITAAVAKSSDRFRGKAAERELAEIESDDGGEAAFDEAGYQSNIKRLIATLTREILKVLETTKEFTVVENADEIDAPTRNKLGEPGQVNLYLDEQSGRRLRTQLENGDAPFELVREDDKAGYVLKHEGDIGDGFDFRIMVLYQEHVAGDEAEENVRTVDTAVDDDRNDTGTTKGHNNTHQGANTGPRSLAG